MNPYLIDRGTLKFYIILAVLLIIASFFLGYFTGQYRADKAITQLEAKPEINIESDLQTPSDMDAPDAALNEQTSEPEQKSDREMRQPKQAEARTDKPAKPVVKTSPVKSLPSTQIKPVSKAVKEPVVNTRAPQETESVTSVVTKTNESESVTKPETRKTRFSIQAGMYSSLENANNYVDQLQIAGFDSYMDEHEGADGTIRYNVRFGNFTSRAEAEQSLESYQQNFDSPAYVIILQ